ncbi:hypothetical protein J7L68_09065, partial [bacterium]|nr:hypothetical protein [bacterium]
GGTGYGILAYGHGGDDNYGGEFPSGTSWGRIGSEGTNTFGAYFDDGGTNYAYIAYNFSGTDYKILGSGTASTIMNTRNGKRVLFCPESPEIWFEDYGSAKLVDGKCHIELDPLFLDCVTIDENYPMKVFVQLNDECNGVYVKKGKTGFDVYELARGTSDAQFDYRILGKRKGDEDVRFPDAPPRLKPCERNVGDTETDKGNFENTSDYSANNAPNIKIDKNKRSKTLIEQKIDKK